MTDEYFVAKLKELINSYDNSTRHIDVLLRFVPYDTTKPVRHFEVRRDIGLTELKDYYKAPGV